MLTPDDALTHLEPLVPFQPGDVLVGKYRVERILGVGGMGVVVAATHLGLHEPVALKFLLPGATRDETAIRRFEREAHAAVRLKGEHVARVLDVGVLENGSPFLVMEYLDGLDLGAVLEAEGPLPPARAVDYVLEACEAIAEAHALGVVHRDLKPKNLFLARRADGRSLVKVLDFGISKVTSDDAPGSLSLTRTTEVFGSPSYMPPEQLRASRDADERADVWALGVILFELVSGRVPFEAQTVTELCAKVFQDEPAALRSLRPEVPAALARVVDRCLQKRREDRYASIADLAAALAPFGTGAAPRFGGTAAARSMYLTGLRSPTRRRTVALSLVAAAVATVAIAVLASSIRKDARPAEAPPRVEPSRALAEPAAPPEAAEPPPSPAFAPPPTIEPGPPATAAARPRAPAPSTGRSPLPAPVPDDDLPATRH